MLSHIFKIKIVCMIRKSNYPRKIQNIAYLSILKALLNDRFCNICIDISSFLYYPRIFSPRNIAACG